MKSGIIMVMYKYRLVIHNLNNPTTGFIEMQSGGNIKLSLYSGEHSKIPETNSQLTSISYYSENLTLISRQEYVKGQMTNDYLYEYPTTRRSVLSRHRRFPKSRYCVSGKRAGERIYYSHEGFIKSGTATCKGIPYEFRYEYRRKATFDDALLRVLYKFNPESMFPLHANIWFCVPPTRNADRLNQWIPCSKVMQAEFIQNGNVYTTKWKYDHKCHPTLLTAVNGVEEPTPDLILHDHLDVLCKPTFTSFVHEDPLLPFNTINIGFFPRLLRLNKKVSLHISFF